MGDDRAAVGAFRSRVGERCAAIRYCRAVIRDDSIGNGNWCVAIRDSRAVMSNWCAIIGDWCAEIGESWSLSRVVPKSETTVPRRRDSRAVMGDSEGR